MTVANGILLVGVILMFISAFWDPGPAVNPGQIRPSLYKLAWCCFLIWVLLALGHVVVHS